MKTPIHTPYKNGEGGVKIGLSPIPNSGWLEIDDLFCSEIQIKKNLFNTKHNEVYLDTPESIDSQKETLNSIMENLELYHPAHLNKIKANQKYLPNLTPLETAALLVQEDLIIMMPRNKEYFLSAASLCSPSNWSLNNKFNKSLLDLHEHVPSYKSSIGDKVNHLFTKLPENKIFQRFNWSIYESPDLFQPAKNKKVIKRSKSINKRNAGDKLFVRVERQTIKRLTLTKSIVFTVRIHVTPLYQLKQDMLLLTSLKKGIENISLPLKRYKSLDEIEKPLIQWLDHSINTFKC